MEHAQKMKISDKFPSEAQPSQDYQRADLNVQTRDDLTRDNREERTRLSLRNGIKNTAAKRISKCDGP